MSKIPSGTKRPNTSTPGKTLFNRIRQADLALAKEANRRRVEAPKPVEKPLTHGTTRRSSLIAAILARTGLNVEIVEPKDD